VHAHFVQRFSSQKYKQGNTDLHGSAQKSHTALHTPSILFLRLITDKTTNHAEIMQTV